MELQTIISESVGGCNSSNRGGIGASLFLFVVWACLDFWFARFEFVMILM
jgi:hypothetical protein